MKCKECSVGHGKTFADSNFLLPETSKNYLRKANETEILIPWTASVNLNQTYQVFYTVLYHG